jgi:hypothetical protein
MGGVTLRKKNYEKENVFVFCKIPTRYHNSFFLDIGYVSPWQNEKEVIWKFLFLKYVPFEKHLPYYVT